MFDQDKWQEIFSTIRRNKWRTIATAFGVFWGILMLVLLLGAGQGLQNGVIKAMILDATNSIWFIPDRTALPYRGHPPGRRIEFNESIMATVREQVEGVEYISAENWLFGNFNIVHGQKSSPFMTLGVGDEYFNIKIYQRYIKGRKLNALDMLQGRKVCVIGERVMEVLFDPEEDPIGKQINIKGVSFTVVGVFQDDGNNGRFSERIYVPLSIFQRIYNPDRSIRLFAVTTKEGYVGTEVEAEVKAVIYDQYAIHPDDNQAMFTHNQEEGYRQVMGLFFGIKTFVWIVGIGTLLAGIVGVSNIMLIIVKERTREIGVRKALGATPRSIVSMIVQEAILITGVAGYFGLLVGIALIFGLNSVMEGQDVEYFYNPTVQFEVAFAAVIVLIIAGALAGLFPALRAARINPIEALRVD
ncbi:MAG: ABC transporter permease [Bacteroidota bacterium]